MNGNSVPNQPKPTRRRLLSGAGVVAAGSAAAVLTGQSSASAASGDPVKLGQANDAGTTSTIISNYGSAPLELANPDGPTLRLAPTPDAGLPVGNAHPQDTRVIGTMAVDITGDLMLVADWDPGYPDRKFATWAFSTRWATMTVPVSPTRVLDTRYPEQRTRIISGAENIDSSGRLKANTSIVLSFDEYVELGEAIQANVTIAATAGAGFLTVWGGGTKPTASSLNWWGPNQILSNAVLCPLGTQGGAQSAVAIYANQTTAVIVDLTALEVGGPWQVLADVPGGAAAAEAARVTRAKRGAFRRPGDRELHV